MLQSFFTNSIAESTTEDISGSHYFISSEARRDDKVHGELVVVEKINLSNLGTKDAEKQENDQVAISPVDSMTFHAV